MADTATSHVFRASRHGESVIVKCFKNAGLHELDGLAYLKWRDGHGAVRVYDQIGLACLMEDAGETTLRKLHAEMGEDAANRVLANTLPRLFEPGPGPLPTELPDMRTHFDELFVFADRDDLGALEEPVRLAAETADSLIAGQQVLRPLHGDIHHENLVTRDSNHWLLIDPQGLIGDPHYDVANLFGNPNKVPETVLDPRRVKNLADMLSHLLGLDRERMLKFALAHCGLSVAWSLNKHLEPRISNTQERLGLLGILRSIISNDYSIKSP